MDYRIDVARRALLRGEKDDAGMAALGKLVPFTKVAFSSESEIVARLLDEV